jgi:hypothetical protein
MEFPPIRVTASPTLRINGHTMPTVQPLRGTPATGSSGRSLSLRLSPKMREAAAKRLAGLTLLMAAVVVLVLVFQQMAQPQLAGVFRDPVIRLTALGVVLLALGVFALQRFRIATASAVLVLGMVFEVAVAFAISIVETAVPFVPNEPVLGISSLGPWIVLVGVIIPNRARAYFGEEREQPLQRVLRGFPNRLEKRKRLAGTGVRGG